MIELALLRVQARHRVAQAVAIGQLRERHAAELVLAAEALHRPVAAEPLDAAAQLCCGRCSISWAKTILPSYMARPPWWSRESQTFAARAHRVQVDDSNQNCITARKSIASAIAPITGADKLARPRGPGYDCTMTNLFEAAGLEKGRRGRSPTGCGRRSWPRSSARITWSAPKAR